MTITINAGDLQFNGKPMYKSTPTGIYISPTVVNTTLSITRSDAESAFGVPIEVLVHLGVLKYVDTNNSLNYYRLVEHAKTIEAIRNDSTGLTAAMYGINLDNTQEE
ncbi:hypothetical protein [Aeromonas veronii]|uniref:hypothetical protein n=1 Tax=Aeromonas veronii TaxID=654 RepID=UPI003B9E0ACA